MMLSLDDLTDLTDSFYSEAHTTFRRFNSLGRDPSTKNDLSLSAAIRLSFSFKGKYALALSGRR